MNKPETSRNPPLGSPENNRNFAGKLPQFTPATAATSRSGLDW